MTVREAPRDRPILEAVLESGETAVKVLIASKVAENIPVVGTAFKLCKALDAVRDRLLMAKLAAFLREVDGGLGDRREEALAQFANGEGANRVGSLLVATLDSVAEEGKAKILGELFVAHLRGSIDRDVLCRLTRAVDLAFYEDLLDFLRIMGMPVYARHFGCMRYLALSGLVEIDPSDQEWKATSVKYKISELGARLKNALPHYQDSA